MNHIFQRTQTSEIQSIFLVSIKSSESDLFIPLVGLCIKFGFIFQRINITYRVTHKTCK